MPVAETGRNCGENEETHCESIGYFKVLQAGVLPVRSRRKPAGEARRFSGGRPLKPELLQLTPAPYAGLLP